MGFVRTALLRAFLSWCWQMWRKKRQHGDRDVLAVKLTWSLCNKCVLAGDCASHAQHSSKHQEVKTRNRRQACFLWTFV